MPERKPLFADDGAPSIVAAVPFARMPIMEGQSNNGVAPDRALKLRAFFARYITTRGGAKDQRIEAAFAAVPREPFAGPGPWSILVDGRYMSRNKPSYVQTPDDDPAFLYQNVLVALDPSRGINIGEPSLHAHCLDALAPQSGQTVLQVGAGSGYYTAILAHLVGSGGQVFAFEIDAELASRAAQNLLPWPWVIVHARSGTVESLPSADAIYVNAGVTQPSWVWLDALRSGGKLLFPLQAMSGLGGMLLIEKPQSGGSAWPARFVTRATFIACETRQDEAIGRALSNAFASGGWESVRTVRFDNKPDDTCWLDGGDWWLSTSAV
jgi:protein-L-isoaspartate(D-aspartate) O-methyltransferase